jgi:hypothetical protein
MTVGVRCPSCTMTYRLGKPPHHQMPGMEICPQCGLRHWTRGALPHICNVGIENIADTFRPWAQFNGKALVP